MIIFAQKYLILLQRIFQLKERRGKCRTRVGQWTKWKSSTCGPCAASIALTYRVVDSRLDPLNCKSKSKDRTSEKAAKCAKISSAELENGPLVKIQTENVTIVICLSPNAGTWISFWALFPWFSIQILSLFLTAPPKLAKHYSVCVSNLILFNSKF